MKNLLPILALLFLISSCSPKLGNKVKQLTGDSISDNFIAALGGAKKLKAVKTMTMIAVAEIQGVEIQIESYRNAPDKMFVKMITPQGTMNRILNGDKAVAITPNGNMPITGIDLEALQEEATIFPELYREELGHKTEYVGVETVNNRAMYKVKVTIPSGKSRFHFYDKETHLLTKLIDELGGESLYSDYRAINGVKLPHSNKMVTPQGTLNFKITKVEINPKLDETMFEIK